MVAHVLQAAGGLGLFILGMLVMTEGLRALAGDALHRTLRRFTKSPVSGAATGTVLTALLQSSSATTVAVVGFVGAGLLTFSEALGVMFGANAGTTLTGWIVALVGFELELGRVMLPLVLGGVLLRLFGRGRVASGGWALAGFALIFVGIEELRTGMATFEGAVTPADFPSDTWDGRLLLIGIGAVVTLVTQSSSAGVAAALTAVDAGAISFAQAAAMVIGMDVGTTATSALATVGGSVATRRTGFSHVVYNVMTGTMAYLLLGPYVHGLERFMDGGAASSPTLALVGFHTLFNVLGVVLVLPFTRQFASLMSRLVPDRESELAEGLEKRFLREPATATLALLGALRRMTRATFAWLEDAVDPVGARLSPGVEPLADVEDALRLARDYAGGIEVGPERREPHQRLLSAMHVIDHLDRLVERCQKVERLESSHGEARLRELSGTLTRALHETREQWPEGDALPPERPLREARDDLRDSRRPFRERVLAEVPKGRIELASAIERLDAIRWLHRVSYHAWRIVHHLVLGQEALDAVVRRESEEPDDLEPPETD